MPKPLSYDLRSRVLVAIDEGLSCRQAAVRFGVSAASAIRWTLCAGTAETPGRERRAATGSHTAPRRMRR